MPRIGELLIAEGVLSEVAVQSALGFQRHTGEPFRLGTILLDRDLLGEESLLKALAAIHRCDFATWPQIMKASPQVVRILPERAAIRLAAIPYALEGRGVRVAFKNPSNLAAVDEVSALTGRPVLPAVISEVRLLQAFNLFFARPVPIEFRNVLQKLERNEERRLFRTRATDQAIAAAPLEGRFVNPRAPVARPEAREIRIAPGLPQADAGQPESFSAPFASAENPQSDAADVPGFLPEYTPARPESADERAAGMWKDEAEVHVHMDAASSPVPASAPAIAPPPPARPVAEAEPPTGRDQIAESALDALALRFPRVLLLVSAQESVQGWTARGGRLTRSRIEKVRIPWGEPSIFAFVKLSGSAHRGGLSRILMPSALTELLGEKATASCAVFPVRIKDRLVAFLYADRAGAPLSEDDYRTLEISASSLGSSLARLLVDLRRSPAAS